MASHEIKYPSKQTKEVKNINTSKIKHIKFKTRDLVDKYCTTPSNEFKYDDELKDDVYLEFGNWRSLNDGHSCFDSVKKMDKLILDLSQGSRDNLINLLEKLIYTNHDDKNSRIIYYIAKLLNDENIAVDIFIKSIGLLNYELIMEELDNIKNLPHAIAYSIIALYPAEHYSLKASFVKMMDNYQRDKVRWLEIVILAQELTKLVQFANDIESDDIDDYEDGGDDDE